MGARRCINATAAPILQSRQCERDVLRRCPRAANRSGPGQPDGPLCFHLPPFRVPWPLPTQVLLPEPSARRASRNSPKDHLPTSDDCSTWPAGWRHRQHTAWAWQMTTLCMWHVLAVSAVLGHARAIGVSLHLIPRPRAPRRLVLFTEASPIRGGRSDEASMLHQETLHAGLFCYHPQEATQQASSCRPPPHLQQREPGSMPPHR